MEYSRLYLKFTSSLKQNHTYEQVIYAGEGIGEEKYEYGDEDGYKRWHYLLQSN